MVGQQVLVVRHQRVEKISGGKGVVDGRVDHAGRVAAVHAAEGQVIVPRDQVQRALRLIEVVVVRHGAAEAVLVDREDVHSHVQKQVVDIHDLLEVLARGDALERGHHPLMILLARVGDFAFPDGRVAVQIVVRIVQVGPAGAHAREAAPPGREIRLARLAVPVRGLAKIGRAVRRKDTRVRHAFAVEILHIRQVIGVKTVHIRQIIRRKATVSTRLAAYIHALGLVELAVIHAVIAQQEALLHRLERQVQAPVLAVDRDAGVIVQRRVRAQEGEHVVDQRFLHAGRVGVVVVQDQLVQAIAGLAVHIMVELQLETVAVGIRVAGDG